nr:aspartate aminotransferase family protein [Micromonospora sp. DSM 115978]
MEAEVLAALAELVGYDPAQATGTMTTGGTASNLTGLLLAREHAATVAAATSTTSTPATTTQLRVFCSDVSH